MKLARKWANPRFKPSPERSRMDILYLLIPLSVGLVLLILCGLSWAVWGGQFEAVEQEAERILEGD